MDYSDKKQKYIIDEMIREAYGGTNDDLEHLDYVYRELELPTWQETMNSIEPDFYEISDYAKYLNKDEMFQYPPWNDKIVMKRDEKYVDGVFDMNYVSEISLIFK